MIYKVYRVTEPEEWGMTVHILSGESWEEIAEEISADIIPILDEKIPTTSDFWKKAYVEYLGASDKREINPTEWAYKCPLKRREMDLSGNTSWVLCF